MKAFATPVNVALVLTLGGLLAAIASGLGYRLRLWRYMTGFKVLALAVLAATAGAIAALVSLYFNVRDGSPALYVSASALVVGLVVVVPALLQARRVRQLPYIHDITTDTENPPAFVALLKERAAAPNTAEYGGAEVARLQRAAYPDIEPLRLNVPPARAFAMCLETARRLGWRVAAADPASGRIEASERTRWYGFVDDVVIRVTESAEGARVDVRSVSRVGQSDVGVNAQRIRRFIAAVTKDTVASAG